ncbi:MAG: hypothetical protein OXK80_04730 [Bdellovibrionales bacterium]|nr:hypothetical protein [Bdellovibrionales bacterium]
MFFSKNKFLIALISVFILFPFHILGSEPSDIKEELQERLDDIGSSIMDFLEEHSPDEWKIGWVTDWIGNPDWVSCRYTEYKFLDFDKSEPIHKCYEVNMKTVGMIEYFKEDGIDTVRFFLPGTLGEDYTDCSIANLRIGKVCTELLNNTSEENISNR